MISNNDLKASEEIFLGSVIKQFQLRNYAKTFIQREFFTNIWYIGGCTEASYKMAEFFDTPEKI